MNKISQNPKLLYIFFQELNSTIIELKKKKSNFFTSSFKTYFLVSTCTNLSKLKPQNIPTQHL